MTERVPCWKEVAVGEDGFSLLELLVVMGILTLALSAVVVQLNHPAKSFEPRALALEVMGELRRARSTAVTASRTVFFVFNARERWCQVEDRKRISIPLSTQMTLVSAKPYVQSAEDARIAFFRDGSSTGGTVRLQTDKSVQVISIDWFTARAELAQKDR